MQNKGSYSLQEGRTYRMLRNSFWDSVKFIMACFKRIVEICKTSYGMLMGRTTGAERERSRWIGEGKCGKIEGKRDKRGQFCANKCCLAEPCAWSLQLVLYSHYILFTTIFCMVVLSIPGLWVWMTANSRWDKVMSREVSGWSKKRQLQK